MDVRKAMGVRNANPAVCQLEGGLWELWIFVQVIVRLRPINEREEGQGGQKRCVQQSGPRSLRCLTQPEPTQFTFDHVVGENVSQEALFALVGQPMVQNCIYGYNSSMFAYGQVGLHPSSTSQDFRLFQVGVGGPFMMD